MKNDTARLRPDNWHVTNIRDKGSTRLCVGPVTTWHGLKRDSVCR